MLISETEARKKWCPHVRVEGNNRLHNTITGGVSHNDAAYLCVAGECMAWRSFHLRFSHGGDSADDPQHGYCGLSGEPAID
ncbi:MAG: hypothetical protein H6873_09810 [Hyphomicrobiaceae bacterium]|nr:hypothetical protein [Hyphomicrobiaceae bacterium]